MIEWTGLSEEELVEIAILSDWKPRCYFVIKLANYAMFPASSDFQICTWYAWSYDIYTGEPIGPKIEFFTNYQLKPA